MSWSRTIDKVRAEDAEAAIDAALKEVHADPSARLAEQLEAAREASRAMLERLVHTPDATVSINLGGHADDAVGPEGAAGDSLYVSITRQS